jgi:hypothetical protein
MEGKKRKKNKKGVGEELKKTACRRGAAGSIDD